MSKYDLKVETKLFMVTIMTNWRKISVEISGRCLIEKINMQYIHICIKNINEYTQEAFLETKVKVDMQ